MRLFLGALSLLVLSAGSVIRDSKISGEDISVSWGIIENYHKQKSQNLSRFIIKNEGDKPLPDSGWKMYFSFLRPVKSTETPIVSFKHISGDFSVMSPTPSFPSIAPGDSVVIDFISAYAVINVSDAPGGIYFVFENETPVKPHSYTIQPFTEKKHTIINGNDHTPLATPGYVFKQNRHLTQLDESELIPIVPEPVSYKKGNGRISVTATTHKLRIERGLEKESDLLNKGLKAFGLTLETADKNHQGSYIDLRLNEEMNKPESYNLSVKTDGNILIEGADEAGVFYGIQSLLSLVPVEHYREKSGTISLPEVTIEDYPRFSFRGMFLDVSRNFQNKEAVLKLLDLMARFKLNKFHIHLADDEGWRIQIPGLPELTNVGSRRGHTLEEKEMLHPSYKSGPFVNGPDNHGTGFYTTSEFIEILQFAAKRHIEVIPEVDVPGHSRAAIKSMLARYRKLSGQGKEDAAQEFLLTDLHDPSEYMSVQNYDDNAINPCRVSTYNFMEKVIDEIHNIYKQAGVELTTFHIGGDEVPLGVWAKSPSCLKKFPGHDASEMKHEGYAFFVDSVSTIIESKGLNIGGWEDIGVSNEDGHHVPNKKLADKNIIVNTWNSIWGGGQEDLAYRMANAGYEVVLSNATNLYFDMAIYKHPQEPGLYWAAYLHPKNVFELTPMDIFKSAYVTLMGDSLKDNQFKDKARLNETGKRNIKGIQGQLWSETVRGQKRMEYMIFPKMLALAQRAWSPQPDFARLNDRQQRILARDKAWNEFANILGRHVLPRLDYFAGGVKYNIPTPGAVIDNGLLRANVTYPGLSIRYSTDGSEPTLDSPLYSGAVEVSGPVKLKTFTPKGRSSRSVEVE